MLLKLEHKTIMDEKINGLEWNLTEYGPLGNIIQNLWIGGKSKLRTESLINIYLHARLY